MFYRPADGHGLPHNPFNAIVTPRPIGWISTRDAEGNNNLAPYSFFNGVAYTPPQIMFASTGRKDSLNNIEAARVFAENVIRSAENDSQRLSNAYAAAVSRLPLDSERVLLFAQLGKWRTDYQADKDAAAKLVGVGTKPRDPAFDASELAAWTNICRVILNTSESVTRN